jgi:hypothetical protein
MTCMASNPAAGRSALGVGALAGHTHHLRRFGAGTLRILGALGLLKPLGRGSIASELLFYVETRITNNLMGGPAFCARSGFRCVFSGVVWCVRPQ